MTRVKYTVGESVLCFQGQLIYDAKIQEVKKEGNESSYYVHYKGWNKSWDEWVTDSRLLKNTPDNLAKQKKLNDEVDPKVKHASKRSGASITQTNTEAKVARKSTNTPSGGGDKKEVGSGGGAGAGGGAGGGGGEKRKLPEEKPSTKKNKILEKSRSRSNSVSSIKSNVSTSSGKPAQKPTPQPKKQAEANNKSKKAKGNANKTVAAAQEKPKTAKRAFGDSIQLDLPENLKNVLVDDYDYMVRQRKLTSIPSRYNVEDLLHVYRKAAVGKGGGEALANVDEICRGLKDYFNSALGCQLLYKFERVQYADLLNDNPGVAMSRLYGPVHLLRLITKLGPMLTAADMEPNSLKILVMDMNKLIQYISRHRDTLFQVEDYGTASPEYHRRAM